MIGNHSQVGVYSDVLFRFSRESSWAKSGISTEFLPTEIMSDIDVLCGLRKNHCAYLSLSYTICKVKRQEGSNFVFWLSIIYAYNSFSCPNVLITMRHSGVVITSTGLGVRYKVWVLGLSIYRSGIFNKSFNLSKTCFPYPKDGVTTL